MDYKTHLPKGPATRVKRAIRATYAGVLFEHLSAAFWLFFSVLVSLVGLALLGVHEVIPSGLRVFLFIGAAAFLVVTLGLGVWRFR